MGVLRAQLGAAWSFPVYVQGVGRRELKEGATHISFPVVYFPVLLIQKPGLNNSQAITEAAVLLGAVKHSILLLIHTQAFEIRPDNRGLGCDSQPAQEQSVGSWPRLPQPLSAQ